MEVNMNLAWKTKLIFLTANIPDSREINCDRMREIAITTEKEKLINEENQVMVNN